MNPSGKLTNAWTRSDILLLLRVWEDTFDDPRIQNEPVAVFDNCVHERFHELPVASAGQLYRSPIALKIKRYSLTKSYKFIAEFNRNRYPRVGGEPVAVTGPADWFALSKKQRNIVVQEHYKKTHFTHLDEDMLPAISRIIQKAKEFEPSTTKSASASKSTVEPPPQRSPKPLAVSTPSTPITQYAAEPDDWDRRETTLLIRAWRDTVDGLHHKFLPNQVQLGLNARVYQRFLVLSEGETSRQEHHVSARRAMLTNTYALITDFNQNSGASGSASGPAAPTQGWFSMRKSERKARLAQAMRPCTDIDEAVYNALRRILQKDDQNARMEAFASSSSSAQASTAQAPLRPIMPQPSPVYTAKGLNVWNQEEVLMMVRAWAIVAEEVPQTDNEPLYAFNNRIYRKFFELSQGKTIRTDKALIAKRESVLNSYLFISDFNANKVIAAPSSGGQRNDWFAVNPVDQRYIIKVYYKKVSFSYLDPEMVEIMDGIMALGNKKPPAKSMPAAHEPEPSATASTSTGSSGRATRPNGWTREELFHLLRAWRDVVESGDSSHASAGGLNGRVYQRFLELSGGSSSKPDSSLRSKRQSLTTTFEFIMDFNRKNFLDWFSLKESDRKKHIVNANRLTHCCSNIEEDVFEALTVILGDKSHAKAGTRPSSAVFRQQRAAEAGASGAAAGATTGHAQDEDEDIETASSTAEGSSPNGDEVDSSATPNIDDLGPGSRDMPSSLSSTQAERKRHLVANVLAHIGQQETSHRDDNDDNGGGTTGTQPRSQQQQEPARKKPKLESDIALIANMFEAQTQHLASLLEQIKDERKLEHDERRVLLRKIQQDQDERQRDRDERAAEREHTRREWEQMREERKLEREQDRLLMKAVLAQKGEKENVVTSKTVASSGGGDPATLNDREPLQTRSDK